MFAQQTSADRAIDGGRKGEESEMQCVFGSQKRKGMSHAKPICFGSIPVKITNLFWSLNIAEKRNLLQVALSGSACCFTQAEEEHKREICQANGKWSLPNLKGKLQFKW